MKDNYLGHLFIAFAVGTLIFFAGAHACQSYPFLAKWVGGECWFDTKKSEATSITVAANGATMALEAEKLYLKAKAIQGGQNDDEVVKAAIHALAQSGSAEAIAALKEIALTHESTSIRKTALYALAQCASAKELLPFYVDLIENGDQLPVRKAAIYAIGQIGNESAVEALEEIATSPHHVSLRKAAVHSLENCESEPAQKALYRILAQVAE